MNSKKLAISTKIEETIELAKISQDPILITGPTGTGKSRLARLIHEKIYPNTQESFLTINPIIYGDLLASNLFGHKKGSFTDAKEDRKGILALDKYKTILIDEIAELPLAVQAKLLVAFDTKEILPIGEDRPIPMKPRVIAATNKNIYDQTIFRNDLIERFPIRIELRPFRELEYSEKIQIIDAIMDEASNITGLKCELTNSGQDFILKGHWHRNNREIRNLINQSINYKKSLVEKSVEIESLNIDRELLQEIAIKIGASDIYVPFQQPEMEESMLNNAYVNKLIDNLKVNLASGIHDQWSIERFNSGWKYGDARNVLLKTNPCLVHFKLLPKFEQEIDLKIAERIIYELLNENNLNLIIELAILSFFVKNKNKISEPGKNKTLDQIIRLIAKAIKSLGEGADLMGVDPKTFKNYTDLKANQAD